MEYGWTIDDVLSLTPAQTSDLANAINKRKMAELEQELFIKMPLEEGGDSEYEQVEIDGKPYLKVSKIEYHRYLLDQAVGKLMWAAIAPHSTDKKKVNEFVDAPAWQKHIDRYRIKSAAKAAKENGLKVPGGEKI